MNVFALITLCCCFFTQPPMRWMRICFTDVFCCLFFVFCFFFRPSKKYQTTVLGNGSERIFMKLFPLSEYNEVFCVFKSVGSLGVEIKHGKWDRAWHELPPHG